MCGVISDTARLLNELGRDKMGKHRSPHFTNLQVILSLQTIYMLSSFLLNPAFKKGKVCREILKPSRNQSEN